MDEDVRLARSAGGGLLVPRHVVYELGRYKRVWLVAVPARGREPGMLLVGPGSNAWRRCVLGDVRASLVRVERHGVILTRDLFEHAGMSRVLRVRVSHHFRYNDLWVQRVR